MKKTLHAIILIAFYLFISNSNAQNIEEAKEAYAKRDYGTAFSIYSQLAEQGNSVAQVWTGIMYSNGYGTPKDESKGIEWMRKSADQDNAIAQNNLGQAYLYGRGVPKDESEAAKWIKRSADQGSPVALYTIGKMYHAGQGINANSILAVKSLKAAIIAPNASPNIIKLAQSELDNILKSRPDLIDVQPYIISTNSNPTSSFNSVKNQISNNPTASSSPAISQINYNSKLLRQGLNAADPRLSCISNIDNDIKIQILNGKISPTIFWDISFPMLSNQAVPTAKEQQAIAYWADELRKCIADSSAYRQKNYSRELISLLDKEDEQLQEAAIDLYNKKTTFGKYNSRVQQIFKESKLALDTLQQNKADQEEQARARAAAMRDAQQRQEQQRMAEQRQAEQRRQAEQSRIAAVRQQWQARCDLDKRNAYEQYTKSKENTCNGPSKGLGVLCVVGNVSAANDYADAAFKSCMSGAPIQ